MRRAKARVDRASEAVDDALKAVTKARADMKSSEKAIEKSKKALEKMKAEHSEHVAVVTKCEAERKVLEEAAISDLAKRKAAEEAHKAAEKVLVKAKAAHLAADADSKRLREADRDAQAACDEAGLHISGLKKKVAAWSAKLAERQETYQRQMQEYLADVLVNEVHDDESMSPAAGCADVARDDALSSDEAVCMSRRRAHLLTRMGETAELPIFSATELVNVTVDDVQRALAALETELEQLSKKANMTAITEYREKDKEYLRRVDELDAASTMRDNARREWEGLRKRRLDEFMSGFRYARGWGCWGCHTPALCSSALCVCACVHAIRWSHICCCAASSRCVSKKCTR
ncbi:MAG: hypothetical protein EOO65_03040 [Methanosarcinales archaeon]|nr:MAG: hypothetical protein EOO65_03040 [Methanosarcinales archaeon]